jgi:hypothetical protein
VDWHHVTAASTQEATLGIVIRRTVTNPRQIASNKCGSLRFGEATLLKEAGNCMRKATGGWVA